MTHDPVHSGKRKITENFYIQILQDSAARRLMRGGKYHINNKAVRFY